LGLSGFFSPLSEEAISEESVSEEAGALEGSEEDGADEDGADEEGAEEEGAEDETTEAEVGFEEDEAGACAVVRPASVRVKTIDKTTQTIFFILYLPFFIILSQIFPDFKPFCAYR
jgi:hypothetical protein